MTGEWVTYHCRYCHGRVTATPKRKLTVLKCKTCGIKEVGKLEDVEEFTDGEWPEKWIKST